MNLVAEMLLSEPAPAVIWATLIVLTFPALLLLGGLDSGQRPLREMLAALRRRGEHRRRRAAEAERAAQYAAEVRVAADRAATGAGRWQEMWERSADEATAAWEAWLTADSRLRALLTGTAWGRPWSARTCEEYAARERFLHRAVAAAVSRGELPVGALTAYAWDARLHPVEQELVIARTSAAWLRHRYEQAVAAERAAHSDADLAHRASRSLALEARTAADEAARLSAFRPAPGRARHLSVPLMQPSI
ncbi:hypothetical protein [Actinoplanes sp. URMC 104]|uniref:hypothetical protein n=1 Tax=Actinoplanes sp. URMC 104 TaxID=3423409 RepID=UPI003F1B4ACB